MPGVVVCLSCLKCFHCLLKFGEGGALLDDLTTAERARIGQDTWRWDATTTAKILMLTQKGVGGFPDDVEAFYSVMFYDFDCSAVRSATKITPARSPGASDDASPVEQTFLQRICDLPPACAFEPYARGFPVWLYVSSEEWERGCHARPGADIMGKWHATPINPTITSSNIDVFVAAVREAAERNAAETAAAAPEMFYSPSGHWVPPGGAISFVNP